MYIKSDQKQKGILFVDDNFASVQKINPLSNAVSNVNRDIHFKFYFKVSQTRAIQENAYSVIVTIRLKNKEIPVIIPNINNDRIDSEKLVDNILTNTIKIRKQLLDESDFIVAEKTADITSKIDNKFLTAIKQNIVDENQFLKTKVLVKRKNDVESIEDFENSKKDLRTKVSTANSSGDIFDLKLLENNNLLQRKNRLKLINLSIPPSSITSSSRKSLTPYQFLTGCNFSKNTFKNSILDSLSFFHHIENISDKKRQTNKNLYETVIDQKFDDLINVSVDFIIKQSVMFQSQPIVEFKLVKNILTQKKEIQRIVVETVEKNLDMIKLYNDFLFDDLKAFSVGVCKTNQNITLQIKNYNEGSCVAQIFTKELKDFNSSIYQKASSFVFDSKNQIGCYKLIDRDIDAIYRIVASDENSEKLSNDFTDVVIRNPRKIFHNDVIVIPKLNPNNIGVNIINNSYNFGIVAFKILYRNLTKKETNYTLSTIVSVNEFSNIYDTLITTGLIPYNTYEIKAKLVYENGVEVFSKSSNTIQYIPYYGNLFTLKVNNLVSSQDITFDIGADLQEDQVGQIRNLLSQVSSAYDTNYYNSKKAEYDKFVAFQIFRYSLIDGSCDDLGIINNNTSFSDNLQSSIKNASKLAQGAKIRYVIYPLIRDPETVTETKKEYVDQETKKRYTVNLRKSRHPLTLMRGSVLSKSRIDNDIVPDMLYGMIGNSITLDVNYGIEQFPSITNFIANRINNKKVILSWSITGNIKKFDHILVFKEENSIKTLIGKTHCFQEKYDFNYNLSMNDIGNIRFSLTPIHQDYSSGLSIISNYVLVTNDEVE